MFVLVCEFEPWSRHRHVRAPEMGSTRKETRCWLFHIPSGKVQVDHQSSTPTIRSQTSETPHDR